MRERTHSTQYTDRVHRVLLHIDSRWLLKVRKGHEWLFFSFWIEMDMMLAMLEWNGKDLSQNDVKNSIIVGVKGYHHDSGGRKGVDSRYRSGIPHALKVEKDVQVSIYSLSHMFLNLRYIFPSHSLASCKKRFRHLIFSTQRFYWHVLQHMDLAQWVNLWRGEP